MARLPPDRGPAAALASLVHEAALGRISDPYRASALVYTVLLELVRRARHPEAPSFPAPIAKACRLLDEGWNRPWKLGEVARAVGLSAAHLHRLFRRHTGVTPLGWLSRRRMEEAVERLGTPGATVQSVARALGFLDTGHFIRVFRHWTGTTPGSLKSRSAWMGSKIVLSMRHESNSAPPQSGVL